MGCDQDDRGEQLCADAGCPGGNPGGQPESGSRNSRDPRRLERNSATAKGYVCDAAKASSQRGGQIMSEPINLLVVDLSHYDPASDYTAVKDCGIVGIIYKATQGQSYTDPTYQAQRAAAKNAGLKWGSYHFGDGSDSDGQVVNYLAFAQVEADELFCLDYEDNGNSTMGLEGARNFISGVESGLNRPGGCV